MDWFDAVMQFRAIDVPYVDVEPERSGASSCPGKCSHRCSWDQLCPPFGAAYLWRTATDTTTAVQQTWSRVGMLVFTVGLILAACAIAVVRFGFIGGGANQRPAARPSVAGEHLLAVLYGLPAVGASRHRSPP